MASKQRTNDELVRALSSQLHDEMLSEECPIEEVQNSLRDAGADPNEIGQRGAALVADLAKKRRLAWQAKAVEARDMMQARLVRRQRVADMPRTDLLSRIAEARRDPRLKGPLVLAARNLNEDSASDDALRQIVEDLEALALLADKDPKV